MISFEKHSSKLTGIPRKIIFSLWRRSSSLEPQRQDSISLCVLSLGHQKRRKWWSCFFSFLSQRVFAPLMWTWAIPSNARGTFSVGDPDLWHEEVQNVRCYIIFFNKPNEKVKIQTCVMQLLTSYAIKKSHAKAEVSAASQMDTWCAYVN